MALARHELLALIELLNKLSRLPADMSEAFERISSITRAIESDAPVPEIAALALDVRFKAEDIYARPHLTEESTLRQMLEGRLHRLEAAARINASG